MGERKRSMSDLKVSQTVFNITLLVAQVLVVYIVIAISLYNLTKGTENKELWISLLSSSVGYLLPSPIISKNVLDTSQ